MHDTLSAAPVTPAAATRQAQRLFIPGPTDVLPEVLAAQNAPMIGHRSDEFEALFAKCEMQLKQRFETTQRVYVVVSSRNWSQEAAIRHG